MLQTNRTQSIALALAGPAAAGAAAGFRSGALETVRLGAALPATVIGVAVLTLPALYVATTYVGASPSLDRLSSAALAALRDAGIALLGLAPALLFLAATSDVDHARAWSGVAFAASAFVTVRALSRGVGLGAGSELSHRAVFGAWALVSVAIGGLLAARVLSFEFN